ncbi:glycosyltransferase family 2 protein [Oryzobacter telluris]|uniref:glycosyltransferase family 2 protein n=1 Tax=Oryzobacter telluris TaxID=3149179 RepID=UPI00370DE2A0
MPAPAVDLTVVVPMFNEEEVLPLLVERLRPVADAWGVTYEVLCVDDGSTDTTPVVLQRLRRTWEQLRVVRLRANAGHQAAISAGLARARGRWVVTIDADLQDPPEVIGEMLAVARGQGVDVVYGVREDRSTDTAFKRVTARAFYRSIRRLSDVDAHVDAGDFRLMSRATVDAVNALPEHNRVLRLVVPALGFPSASVGYRRAPRAAGDSKYPLGKMLRLSVDGVTGFSTAPLRFATWLGLLGGVAALLVLLYAVVAMLLGNTLPGWTSTVVIVAAVGAVQLLALGILGEYVGRTYTALQGRPSYFVAHDSAEASAVAGLAGVGPEPREATEVTEVTEERPEPQTLT